MGDSQIQSQLDLLTAVEKGVVVTQAALTKRIGISIGLINALLKRAILKGYVKTRQAPYKRYAYYLTPAGFAQKSRLVAQYLDHSLRFYRAARSEYAELFAFAKKSAKTRVVLVGNSELAEIAVLAAWSEDVTLLGIVDPRANQAQTYGLNVLRTLTDVQDCDAVVITEVREPQRIYDEMRARLPATRVLVPPLLKITTDQADLIVEPKCLGAAS